MRDNETGISKRKGLSLRVQRRNKSVLELLAQLISASDSPSIVVGRHLLASFCPQELRRQATLRNIISSYADQLLSATIQYDFQYTGCGLLGRQEHTKIHCMTKQQLRNVLTQREINLRSVRGTVEIAKQKQHLNRNKKISRGRRRETSRIPRH